MSVIIGEAKHRQIADTLPIIHTNECTLIQLDEHSETLIGLEVTTGSFQNGQRFQKGNFIGVTICNSQSSCEASGKQLQSSSGALKAID